MARYQKFCVVCGEELIVTRSHARVHTKQQHGRDCKNILYNALARGETLEDKSQNDYCRKISDAMEEKGEWKKTENGSDLNELLAGLPAQIAAGVVEGIRLALPQILAGLAQPAPTGNAKALAIPQKLAAPSFDDDLDDLEITQSSEGGQSGKNMLTCLMSMTQTVNNKGVVQ